MHNADKLSQHALQNIHCIKEAAKPKTVDKLTQQIAIEPERPAQVEQAATTP